MYTLTTRTFTTMLAIFSMSYVPAVIANEPTPWMGATERTAQYATNRWYVVLAVMLRRRTAAEQAGR